MNRFGDDPFWGTSEDALDKRIEKFSRWTLIEEFLEAHGLRYTMHGIGPAGFLIVEGAFRLWSTERWAHRSGLKGSDLDSLRKAIRKLQSVRRKE